MKVKLGCVMKDELIVMSYLKRIRVCDKECEIEYKKV